MSKLSLLAMSLLLAAAGPLGAVAIKVTAIDHRKGTITLLLPIHHALLEATLAPEEPEIRVRPGDFYDGDFEQGSIDTVKRNVLKVKIPGERPARFVLRKITFLSN